ncbi:MAG: hypothetical protein JSS66_17060 [Armatimonadetes bacterium]|nr:hypothetical protein [Armatimonadota bacterium]
MPRYAQSQPNFMTGLEEVFYFPALTLMVFMRRRIGLRLLSPARIIRTFVLIQLYAVFAVFLLGGSALDIRIVQGFSFVFLLIAAAQYWRSWRAFNRGSDLHTLSSGFSHLETGHIPNFLRYHRRIYRIGDPLFCLAVACYAWIVCPPLGLWIGLASLSLRMFEQARYEAALTRDFEIVDSMAEAKIQQDTAEFFSKPKARNTTNQPPNDRVGLPTGIGPDIELQIAQRSKEKQS